MNHHPRTPSFLEGKTVVLASRSPRRQELLRLITEDFTVRVSHFDERPLMAKAGSLSPEELVKALSAGKAQAVLAECPDALVIGGDTVVVSPDGEIFGIPRDREDAARMLRALSGRSHRVVTGMTICGDGSAFSFAVSTDVEFYPLSEAEIAAYLDTGEPFDKAGGYGIQGYGGLLVRGIRGSYDNVVGLPAAELSRNLRKFCQK
ncbi:MAG TPA: septum formation protein Maf [Candidatus Merdivicinus faecavium]|nr:septum formation protein Maf [Candidatus Merdivicinus faecavium]